MQAPEVIVSVHSPERLPWKPIGAAACILLAAGQVGVQLTVAGYPPPFWIHFLKFSLFGVYMGYLSRKHCMRKATLILGERPELREASEAEAPLSLERRNAVLQKSRWFGNALWLIKSSSFAGSKVRLGVTPQDVGRVEAYFFGGAGTPHSE